MNRAEISPASPVPPRRLAPWITSFVLAALAGLMLWRGFDYYRQGLSARAMHPDYRLLNPGGLLGHGYGMVGTALVLTDLLYPGRRRFSKYIPPQIGSMKAQTQSPHSTAR